MRLMFDKNTEQSVDSNTVREKGSIDEFAIGLFAQSFKIEAYERSVQVQRREASKNQKCQV